MLRSSGDATLGDGTVAFKLKADKIWGPRENLPFKTDFCVSSSGGLPLYCTNPDFAPGAQSIERAIVEGGKRLHEWNAGEASQLGSTWQLFLTGAFAAPSLYVTASQPKSFALQSNADFGRVFIPALALVILLVGLLSLTTIGRSLVPLQYLIAAAKQLASGNLSARVRIHTDDELGSLADAFNNMAGRLEQQIVTLEAMSGIDRLILTGASFEEVSESVITHLVTLTRCDVAAVIARDESSTQQAQMVSGCQGDISHDLIALPQELGNDWCQPRQVSLEEIDISVAPYKEQFLAYGQKYVVIIPVVLHDDLKGILLIGTTTKLNMGQANVQRCIDLAGRFAVALSSVERKDELYRQAHYDELTSLPNRQLMKERLGDMIEQARAEGHTGGLLYLDLDRFKEINDVYGHSVGDVVLTQAAERIINEVRDSDLVSRLGGDEFVVVLPRIVDTDCVKVMANRLLARLTEVFSVFGVNHFVGVSIGIVIFPDDGDSVETLLKNADSAMYRAKEAGRARYEFFNVESNDESRRLIELERDLRAAFAAGQLEVYYQPQFDLESGVISGAEALLRWKHAEFGFVSPTEFIPLAEDTQLIVDIGHWVIEQTCKDLRQILDKGLHPGPVSINVSARQLRESRFPNDVLNSLLMHDIHPGYLQLEVTETTVAQNRDTAIDLLNILREKGVRVAIDDFGTGYSSLSYLQNMPFDVIKIDKSFVELIGLGMSSDNICRTIIKMARELGKTSIAEGVESREQIDFLSENDCDMVQGFFYSEPLPLLDFIAFIRKQDFHTQRRKALEIV
jgi:diguanylate cyclase (GGDEF)-like protein